MARGASLERIWGRGRDSGFHAFDDIASRWARLSSQLNATGGDIKRTLGRLDGWHGGGAEAARAHFGDVRSGYETAGEYIERIPPALRQLSDAISAARATVNDVVDTVDSTYPLYISSSATGEVHAGFGGPGDTRTDEEQAQDRATAQELTRRVQQALEDVSEADRAASSALAKASPSSAGLELEAVGSANIVTPSDIPGDDASPREVHQWWNSLTPMEQESAIYTHGDVIGGMDGIPIEARDRANQIRFAEDHAEIGARHAALEGLGDDRTGDQQREYEQLSETLRGMNAIDERVEREPSDTQPQSYLVDYSTEGNGRGIVATGNPDTADNVVTSVPGTGAKLGGISGQLERSDMILTKADQLSPRTDTAAITWVGYDAPQDLGQATNAHYAEDAADDLRSFQHGLDATHEEGGDWNNTVIGHSYGSTVIGHAAQGENAQLNVDNVVLIGSPGVGVDHASELEVPVDAEIYASTAENDVIQLTPSFIHGPQPISDEFGAQTFESDPGTEASWGYSTEAHSEYWNRDSASLNNMGRIVVGGEPH